MLLFVAGGNGATKKKISGVCEPGDPVGLWSCAFGADANTKNYWYSDQRGQQHFLPVNQSAQTSLSASHSRSLGTVMPYSVRGSQKPKNTESAMLNVMIYYYTAHGVVKDYYTPRGAHAGRPSFTQRLPIKK